MLIIGLHRLWDIDDRARGQPLIREPHLQHIRGADYHVLPGYVHAGRKGGLKQFESISFDEIDIR